MTRELEAARLRIEQLMIEHQTTCEQIDVVRCETDNDHMAYTYTACGQCFPILIELVDDIGHPGRDWWEERLWPRLSSAVVH